MMKHFVQRQKLDGKDIYYQNMFNKTNESTIVETALAISGLAMVFIPSMARPDTG